MKKWRYILLLTLTLAACSTDDSMQPDLIIGKWGKMSVIDNGVLTTLDPQVASNQIMLNQDGSLLFLGSGGSSGNWVHMGKGTYKIENVQNGITFSVLYKVDFTSPTQMKLL